MPACEPYELTHAIFIEAHLTPLTLDAGKQLLPNLLLAPSCPAFLRASSHPRMIGDP